MLKREEQKPFYAIISISTQGRAWLNQAIRPALKIVRHSADNETTYVHYIILGTIQRLRGQNRPVIISKQLTHKHEHIQELHPQLSFFFFVPQLLKSYVIVYFALSPISNDQYMSPISMGLWQFIMDFRNLKDCKQAVTLDTSFLDQRKSCQFFVTSLQFDPGVFGTSSNYTRWSSVRIFRGCPML